MLRADVDQAAANAVPTTIRTARWRACPAPRVKAPYSASATATASRASEANPQGSRQNTSNASSGSPTTADRTRRRKLLAAKAAA